jgi:hypothetical protein
MFVEGEPPGASIYSLTLQLLGGEAETILRGVTLNEKGSAICAGRQGTCGDSNKPDDPIDLVMLGGLGEPKLVGIVADSGSYRAYATVVPFPMRAVDSGCVLEGTLATANAEVVSVSGHGFQPGELLEVRSRSEREVISNTAKADPDGGYTTIVSPFVKGLPRGHAELTVHTKQCSPSLSFEWGQGSYQLQ